MQLQERQRSTKMQWLIWLDSKNDENIYKRHALRYTDMIYVFSRHVSRLSCTRGSLVQISPDVFRFLCFTNLNLQQQQKQHNKPNFKNLRSHPHTPGRYPTCFTNSLWRNSFLFGCLGKFGVSSQGIWAKSLIAWDVGFYILPVAGKDLS